MSVALKYTSQTPNLLAQLDSKYHGDVNLPEKMTEINMFFCAGVKKKPHSKEGTKMEHTMTTIHLEI